MSLDTILKSLPSKCLSLRLGPVKLQWFPSRDTCIMSTTSENYSFKRNGSVVVITDPEGCMVNIRLKRNGFFFLDMTKNATLDDESGTESSGIDESEEEDAEVKKETKEAEEEGTEMGEEQRNVEVKEEGKNSIEAMELAEGTIKKEFIEDN